MKKGDKVMILHWNFEPKRVGVITGRKYSSNNIDWIYEVARWGVWERFFTFDDPEWTPERFLRKIEDV